MNALAISTPLDSLCSDHQKKKVDIEHIATYVLGESDVAITSSAGHRLKAVATRKSPPGCSRPTI